MDFIDTITLIGALTVIRLIVGILANVDKAWANVCKGWNFVCVMASSAMEKVKTGIVRGLTYTATSPPVDTSIAPGSGALRFNVVDAVNMGLNDGYTKLCFRQNVSAYYYGPNPTSKVFELA